MIFLKTRYFETRVSRVFNKVRFSQSTIAMENNTLGEWSDGDDDWIFDVDENGNNTLGEWSDGDDDWIFDVDENNSGDWSDPEVDEIISDIQESEQTGRGEKRKSDEPLVPEEDFYERESVTKTKSKKFRMSATDHRSSNILALDGPTRAHILCSGN